MAVGAPEAAPHAAALSLRGLAPKFALTGVAAMTAEAATFPLDMTKTRMQLAGESGGARRGALDTAKAILRAEGVAGFYAGVLPAMARHVPYTGTRIAVYEALRARAGADSGVGTKMAMGATAGALGQLLAVPADLTKVRMQAAGAGGGGRARQGMAATASGILRAEGLRGLWRGGLPAVQRAALVNLGELATYDAAKRWAAAAAPAALADACGVADAQDAPPVHVFAALASGFVACAASTPADVVKTRLMAQALQRHVSSAATSAVPPRQQPLYAGALDCVRQSVARDGLRVLYRGFFPTWARLGPWQLTFWLSYEQLRRLAGLGGF